MNHYFLSSSKEELEIVALQCFIQDNGLESDDLGLDFGAYLTLPVGIARDSLGFDQDHVLP
jgi:hypothetical protein